MNVCTHDGCERPVAVTKRQLCRTHYQRFAEVNRPRENGKACKVPDCGGLHYARDLCKGHYNRFQRTGDWRTAKEIRDAQPPVFCQRHSHVALNSKGKCKVCVQIDWYYNGPINGPRLEKRAEDPGYAAMHARVRTDRGRAAEWNCVDCSGQATDWTLKYNASDRRQAGEGREQGSFYSINVWDYEPRCADCHKAYDAKHGNKKERRPYGTYFRDQREAWLRRKGQTCSVS